jgi:hypothetical protein
MELNTNSKLDDIVIGASILTSPIYWIYGSCLLVVRFIKWIGFEDLYYIATLHKYSNEELQKFLEFEKRSIELGLMRKRPIHKRYLSKLAHKRANNILNRKV